MAWNVKGKLANLSEDASILRLFSDCDVLGFSEIGLQGHDQRPELPGFSCVAVLPRPRRYAQGGVACYMTKELASCSRVVRKHDMMGILWVCVTRLRARPLYLAVCYLPPPGSALFQAGSGVHEPLSLEGVFRTLFHDACEFGAKGDVLIMGDLNARTGAGSDLETDWAGWDGQLGAMGLAVPQHLAVLRRMAPRLPARHSTDHVANASGDLLLSGCRAHGLLILNGRLPGDEVGALTFESSNGSSLIDYFVASPGLAFAADGSVHAGCSLEVRAPSGLPNMPGLQHAARFDHGPVYACLRLQPGAGGGGVRAGARPAPCDTTRFRWRPELQPVYVNKMIALCDNGALRQAVDSGTTAGEAAASLVGTITEVLHQLHTELGGVVVEPGALGPKPGVPCNGWYNDECRELRRQLRALPEGSAEHARALCAYRRAIKVAKRMHADACMDAVVQKWYDDPKRFWRAFAEPRPESSMDDLSAWSDYFRQLYTANLSGLYFGGSFENHVAHYADHFPAATPAKWQAAACLNADFTEAEIAGALDRMLPYKSAGVDGMPAEFLTGAVIGSGEDKRYLLAPSLAQLFTVVLKGRVGEDGRRVIAAGYPAGWGVGALAPVPKPKGNPDNRDDYRGIAVGSALSKLYSLALMLRMDAWAERMGMRAEGQCGFRTGRGAADNIFVLQHLTEMAQVRRKPLYCAFIDFRKAYDSVDRGLLWHVIAGMGVEGHVLDTLKEMYDCASMRVRVRGSLGDPFDTTVGVKQGDPLSPLLFGLFIDRVEAWLRDRCPHGVRLGRRLLQVLLYADDLALVAESPAELQALLDCLHEFCAANCLTVNIAKSEVIAFAGKPSGVLHYNHQPLEWVSSFVYLGVCFKSGGPARSINSVVGRNLGKARGCMHAMLTRCYQLGVHNAKLQSNLFGSLVLPVLNYGCEVWVVYQAQRGLRSWGEDGDAERFQRGFLKHMLGVRRTVPGMALLLDTDRAPVMHAWVTQAAGWWNRVVSRPAGDLVYDCVFQSLNRSERTWGAAWRAVMDGLGPAFGAAVRAGERLPPGGVQKRLHALWVEHSGADALRFNRTAVRAIPDDESAGFTLASYLNRFYCAPGKGESYVYHVHRPQRVEALARMRLGSHGLNIDAGRRLGGVRVPRAQRLCQCCVMREVEDELHIVQCPAYVDIRQRFAELFEGLPNVHTWGDTELRCFMNRGTSKDDWNKLADMLICMAGRRKRMVGRI